MGMQQPHKDISHHKKSDRGNTEVSIKNRRNRSGLFAIFHNAHNQSGTPNFRQNATKTHFPLPQLRHPASAYLITLLAQAAVVIGSKWIINNFNSFHFPETLLIMVIVLVSLSWGARPGIFATLSGAALLAFLILPPEFSFALTNTRDIIEVGLYLIVGLTISLLGSQTQRARIATEKAYQQSDQRARELEATFEAMTDGVVIYDETGQMKQINTAYRSLIALEKTPTHINYTPAERGAMLLLRDENGQPLPSHKQPVQRMLAGERFSAEQAIDILVRALDGREVQINITGTPMFDQDQKLSGGVLIFRDVTERRNLERRARDALRTLIAMTETLVLAPNTEGTPTTEVSTAQQLVELTCTLLGCQIASLIAVEHATTKIRPIAVVGFTDEIEQHFKHNMSQMHLYDYLPASAIESLYQGEPIFFDLDQPRAEGKPTYGINQVLGAPLISGSLLVGFLSLDYAIAKHRYPPEEEIRLITAIARLAAVVIERERLMRERAEAQAEKLAVREASYLKDEFIGIAGHELRTPLTTIRMSVQLAKRQLNRALKQNAPTIDELTQTMRTIQGLLERTEQQIGMQNRLVNDLLDVTRIETGRLELQLAQHNLLSLIREGIANQQSLLPKRTLHLSTSLDSDNDEIPVIVDADRVQQVLSNYLSNALKYSAKDQPVEIKVECLDGYTRVVVRDHGIGLADTEQQQIWERFYRAPSAEVKSGSGIGLGLGLHISKTIIEQLGGTVGVWSEPGQGSTFWFTLPLAEHYKESGDSLQL